MGIGAEIKASIDALRNELGMSCTVAGASIGKCGYEELTPAKARLTLGEEAFDELDVPWATIEVAGEHVVREGDAITVTATGREWIVRRVVCAVSNDVLIARRCLCAGRTVA